LNTYDIEYNGALSRGIDLLRRGVVFIRYRLGHAELLNFCPGIAPSDKKMPSHNQSLRSAEIEENSSQQGRARRYEEILRSPLEQIKS
jgi:hypothetical protein